MEAVRLTRKTFYMVFCIFIPARLWFSCLFRCQNYVVLVGKLTRLYFQSDSVIMSKVEQNCKFY